MAQTGYSKVQIYSSSTATHTPSAGNLTNDTNGSELAINITDGKLFYKDNSGTVQVLATKGSGVVGGSNTQVQYNSSGTFAGSANLTFDGTTLTSSGFSGPLNGTVGATTANTGAFTTLSASSTVSGTGFSTYLASPPAIGGTAAASGSFTTVTAGTSVTTPFVTSAAATNLILKSAGTTAVTIDTSQKVTFANSIGFGSNAGITFNNSSALTNSTLNDYEIGTWTPTDTSGAGLSFTVTSAQYVKVGQMVTATAVFQYPTTVNTNQCNVGGLPFATNMNNTTGSVLSSNAGAQKVIQNGSTTFLLFPVSSVSQSTNVTLSNASIYVTFHYRATF